MFLDFYRLREQPFGVTPDPRYLYFSPTHREALASLFYGIETGRGFLALLAEPGMGKTTLLFQLLERLKDSVRSAFLFQTQCDSRELFRYLLDALGLDSHDQDPVRMHGQLNEFLFREALAGRRVVLVIDEAQNLSDSVLETVRLLSDFEAPDKKLLQIVLAGQPELAHRLLCPGLGQLRQRIAVRARLDPLPAAEAVRYINHRLQVAGYDGPELFTPPALALIAERSQGIPRNINNICFSALSLGCATECKKVGPEIVQEAIADLSFDSLVPQPQPAPPITPSLPIAPQFSSYSTTVGDRRKGRLIRTAALAAVFGCFAVYLGERGKAGTTPPSPAIPANIAAAERSAEREESSQRTAASSISSVRRPVPLQGSRIDDPSTSSTHVVQPNDTLWKLCLSSLGRCDADALAEIRKLNQDLKDPNYIEVGQRIRFPRSPSN